MNYFENLFGGHSLNSKFEHGMQLRLLNLIKRVVEFYYVHFCVLCILLCNLHSFFFVPCFFPLTQTCLLDEKNDGR